MARGQLNNADQPTPTLLTCRGGATSKFALRPRGLVTAFSTFDAAWGFNWRSARTICFALRMGYGLDAGNPFLYIKLLLLWAFQAAEELP